MGVPKEMSYEEEMYEYHDEMQERSINKPYLKLCRKNLITSKNLPLKSLLWEYILWILGGKPDNHKPLR